MKKRICFVYDNISGLGGIQRVLINLTNSLIEEYDIDIITTNDKFKAPVDYGSIKSKVIAIKESKAYTICIMPFRILGKIFKKNFTISNILSQIKNLYKDRRVKEIINANRYDAIVALAPNCIMLLDRIRDKINCKNIIACWHSSIESYIENYEKKYGKAFTKTLKDIEKTVVLSSDDKEKIKQRYNVDAIVIPNPAPQIEKRKDVKKKQVILLVGRYDEEKNYELAIKAFYKIQQNNELKNWSMKIVGDGPSRKKLEKLIDNLQLNNKVILTGRTNRVSDFYSEASIFVITSRYEGFPMVLLEAMKAKLPIVATDVPVFHEILPNNQHFVKQDDFDNLANEITKLIVSKHKRQIESANNFNKANEYDIKLIRKKWIDVLER